MGKRCDRRDEVNFGILSWVSWQTPALSLDDRALRRIAARWHRPRYKGQRYTAGEKSCEILRQ
jgi:hypothetical protein